MTGEKKRSPELIAECRRLSRLGHSQQQVARIIGVAQNTVGRWLSGKYHSELRHTIRTGSYGVTVELKAQELLKQIPPDTRDLTARLCGDPIPGRRAIDQKHAPNGP